MRRILIVGIGAGNPDFITLQAIKALNRADVFFIPDKGGEKGDLKRLRTQIIDQHVTRPYRSVEMPIPRRRTEGDYKAGVDEWHARLRADYRGLFLEHLAEGECGALLVWGDPALYDSTLRIVEGLHAEDQSFVYEIIPGITAPQALAAAHRVALNRIGEPVLITTGRRLGEMEPGDPDAVVMLDGELAFRRVRDADVEILWGAYLGTSDEILISGRLGDVADEIERTRARARAEKGWIMDTYLLRRPQEG